MPMKTNRNDRRVTGPERSAEDPERSVEDPDHSIDPSDPALALGRFDDEPAPRRVRPSAAWLLPVILAVAEELDDEGPDVR